MLRLSRVTRLFLISIVALILVFMYTPLFVLILNSFNESQISGWPIENYSTKWWVFAKDYQPIRAALLNSVLVASGAMVIASILGTLVAFAMKGFDFFGKSTVNILVVLPIALPGIVTGVAFSNTYSNFLSPAGINIGYFGMIVAHATFCIVMVFNNVFARLRRM
ncbi:MAG: ABC transporter permease, partial [Candidatus Nanopelagicaceae bacterium]